jgi:hypothetical protein
VTRACRSTGRSSSASSARTETSAPARRIDSVAPVRANLHQLTRQRHDRKRGRRSVQPRTRRRLQSPLFRPWYWFSAQGRHGTTSAAPRPTEASLRRSAQIRPTEKPGNTGLLARHRLGWRNCEDDGEGWLGRQDPQPDSQKARYPQALTPTLQKCGTSLCDGQGTLLSRSAKPELSCLQYAAGDRAPSRSPRALQVPSASVMLSRVRDHHRMALLTAVEHSSGASSGSFGHDALTDRRTFAARFLITGRPIVAAQGKRDSAKRMDAVRPFQPTTRRSAPRKQTFKAWKHMADLGGFQNLADCVAMADAPAVTDVRRLPSRRGLQRTVRSALRDVSAASLVKHRDERRDGPVQDRTPA